MAFGLSAIFLYPLKKQKFRLAILHIVKNTTNHEAMGDEKYTP